jgi:putative DNA primase/helicase
MSDDLMSDIEEIRKLVASRIAEKEIQQPLSERSPSQPVDPPILEGSSLPSLKTKDILYLLSFGELGLGVLYSIVNAGKVLYNASAAMWMIWVRTHYEFDILGKHKIFVENVSEVCGKALSDISEKITACEKAGDSPSADLVRSKKRLFKAIKRLRTKSGRDHCLDFAISNKSAMVAKGDEFDKHPWLLPCRNVVIDLKSGESQPGQPEQYLQKACDIDWLGKGAPKVLWEDTLDKIFLGNAEKVSFFKRLVGMSIVGTVIEQVIIILSGAGANGKSVIMETLCYVLGDLAAVAPSEMLLYQRGGRNSAGPSPDMAMLPGRRLVTLNETDEGARGSESRIKQLSGGDRFSWRNPHDKFMQTSIPSHTLWLVTNNPPSLPGHDFATFRRVILLDFPARFVESPSLSNEFLVDKELGNKLKKEAAGIIAWAVDGCLEWQRDGLRPPSEVLEAKEQYRRNEDLLGQFLEDCCELDMEFEVGASNLFDAFVRWFNENLGKNPPSQKAFGSWMVKRFERNNRKPRIYYGLRLIGSSDVTEYPNETLWAPIVYP